MNPHKLSRLFPNASKSFQKLNEDHPISSGVQSAEPERPVVPTLAQGPAAQAGGAGRIVVSVKACRRRLLDEDNHVTKFIVDGLRYAGLIPSDAPDKVHIRFSQEKSQEDYTIIEITYPES
jgi:hypothetical protein